MTSPPFKIGDRVVCVNDKWSELVRNGVYVVKSIYDGAGDQLLSVSDDSRDLYHYSRFTLEQPAPAHDDYPDSVEDYAHNRPHRIIAWGAAGLLMWLMFFTGLWLGWWLL